MLSLILGFCRDIDEGAAKAAELRPDTAGEVDSFIIALLPSGFYELK